MFAHGVSAGGGLALSVAHKLVANASTRNHIKGVSALAPVTLHPDGVPDEYKSMYKSFEENGNGATSIDAAKMNNFYGELLVMQRCP